MQTKRDSDEVQQNQGRPGETAVDVQPFEPRSPDLQGLDTSMDPESMTLEDWVEAENSRPDMDGETADGLDEMDEEIRRQAEDLPVDAPGRD